MNYSLNEEVFEGFFQRIRDLIIPSESNNYKSRFLQSKTLLYCVVFLLILKIVFTLLSVNIAPNVFFADITKNALENFVNQTRQAIGLKPLAENQKLNYAAQLKAENMIQEQYFQHTSPSGITPWVWFVKAGYNYHYAGENLAIGFYESEEVFNAWLNSPTHKENIVNPNYTEVGTSVLKGFGGSDNSIVVVQEFGSPQVAKVTPKNINQGTVVTQPKPQTTTNKKVTEGNTTTPVVVTEKVLSETIESNSSIGEPTGNTVNNLWAKILSQLIYNYSMWIEKIILAISFIVMGVLLTLLFLNFNINLHKQLVFRALLIVVLLLTATLIDKEFIISLIPHRVII
jgi:hypothetical protein